MTKVLLIRPGIILCETKNREVWVQAFAWGKISTLNYLFRVMLDLNFFLPSLPYVITVCLKTTAQIEVVVSNREKALAESEELRQNYFEVVEAMAMHLM